MSRGAWWLVDQLSQFLETAEREAVRGDLAESAVSGSRALREIFGLVARRQIDLWKTDWRPWLALVGIAIPLAIVLSGLARWMSQGSAVYFWLYWSNTRLTDFNDAGFRYSLGRDLLSASLACATLIAWSWTGGFVLGSLSRRAAWLAAALFASVVWLSPFALAETITDTDGRTWFFILDRAGWPLLLGTSLVLLPALLGAWLGARRGRLSRVSAVFWPAATALLTARWYWGPGTHKFTWFLTLAVLTWPAAYLTFISARRKLLAPPANQRQQSSAN